MGGGDLGGRNKRRTHFPGLSRRPPLLVWSWQQQRIYRIRPSRLNRLSSAGGRRLLALVLVVVVAATSSFPPRLLPLRQASISGKHPPTQWL